MKSDLLYYFDYLRSTRILDPKVECTVTGIKLHKIRSGKKKITDMKPSTEP